MPDINPPSLLAELQAERDRYRRALEIIADRSTADITLHGTIETLRTHARMALRGSKALEASNG